MLFDRMKHILSIILIVFSSAIASGADRLESVCYGTPEKGRIENAWQLPASGANFSAYSALGTASGRNYVHSKVYAVVIDAYAALKQHFGEKVFVYGETGWKNGGGFRPHKTHQNGLSVDFFVPVVDRAGRSVPLPTNVLDKFGYDIEFDTQGRYKDYSIDFEALADHLFALKDAADKRGIKIGRVIFDNELQKLLFRTKQGAELRKAVAFSTKKPWVRHDEHYHVDFVVPCR